MATVKKMTQAEFDALFASFGGSLDKAKTYFAPYFVAGKRGRPAREDIPAGIPIRTINRWEREGVYDEKIAEIRAREEVERKAREYDAMMAKRSVRKGKP